MSLDTGDNHLRAEGARLTNSTSGGDASFEFTPEVRAKLSVAATKKFSDPAQRAAHGARQRGRKQSPETIAKRSKARLGKPLGAEWRAKIGAANRGRTYTDEMRKNMSDAHMGKPHSEARRGKTLGRKTSDETKAKLSAALTGKKHSVPTSPETIAKLSAYMKGKPSPMRGKHHTAEARLKMSQTRKGRKASLETRAKMSAAQAARWARRKIAEAPPDT